MGQETELDLENKIVKERLVYVGPTEDKEASLMIGAHLLQDHCLLIRPVKRPGNSDPASSWDHYFLHDHSKDISLWLECAQPGQRSSKGYREDLRKRWSRFPGAIVPITRRYLDVKLIGTDYFVESIALRGRLKGKDAKVWFDNKAFGISYENFNVFIYPYGDTPNHLSLDNSTHKIIDIIYGWEGVNKPYEHH